jgi:hypothetical protein
MEKGELILFGILADFFWEKIKKKFLQVSADDQVFL